MKKVVLIVSFLLIGFAQKASAIPVFANLQSPTDLGEFSSGTYQISAIGIISLVGPVGTNPNFDLYPDGVPVTGVTYSGYSYFNPDGSDIADGNNGPGGSGINVGAIMGTLSSSPNLAIQPAPVTHSEWFQIGYETMVTLTTTQHIFAMVNDTFYPNNSGYFDVTVSAVPEPAVFALFVLGLAGIGFSRKSSQA